MPYGYTKYAPTKWTPEMRAQLIAKAKAGQSNTSIAREWGLTRDAVTNQRAKLANAGYLEPLRPRSNWTAEEETKLMEMKVAGCGPTAIAKELRKTLSAVRDKIEHMGINEGDLSKPCVWMKYCREATDKLVALLSEHHPEHETRL
jgi:hypothetical protein